MKQKRIFRTALALFLLLALCIPASAAGFTGKLIAITFDDGPGAYNRVLAGLLDQHPAVTVTWFRPDGKKEGGDYLIATGAVRKIDAYREVMILEGGEQIPFRDLLSLSGECLPDNK